MRNLLKAFYGLSIVAGLAVAGCQTQTAPVSSNTATPSGQEDTHSHDHDGFAHADNSEADIVTALAKLSPEDRKAAEAQKFCAVESENLLGSMGTPVKLDINGEAVFVCCSGCKSAALKNPDETLAAVAKMKAANTAESK